MDVTRRYFSLGCCVVKMLSQEKEGWRLERVEGDFPRQAPAAGSPAETREAQASLQPPASTKPIKRPLLGTKMSLLFQKKSLIIVIIASWPDCYICP